MPAPRLTVYKSLDDITSDQLLDPHPIDKPKETVAYLGYSSGTSGKAKGVRTSAYNMTSVLSIIEPIDATADDVHLAVLPLNRACRLLRRFPRRKRALTPSL